MKILCISSSYPRFDDDIAGHFVEELNELLRSAGNEVQILSWRGENTRDREGVSFVPYAPPPLETLFFQSGAPENLSKLFNNILIIPAMVAMWRAIVKQERPDLVVGHWAIPGGILARLAGHYFGVPSLIIGHSGGLHRLKKMSENSLIKSLVLDGPLTIPSSAFRPIAPNATFMPIGFKPVVSSRAGDATEDALIMSRLEPIKNVDRVIRAWKWKDKTLHIAGEGSCRSELEELSRSLGHRVVFHGQVTGEAKSDLMSAAKYFFLPSKSIDGRHEGFPIGLLQAIDFGLIPLVAFFPGAEDILDREFIVDVDEDWETRFDSFKGQSEKLSILQEKVRARRWSNLYGDWIRLFNDVFERFHRGS